MKLWSELGKRGRSFNSAQKNFRPTWRQLAASSSGWRLNKPKRPEPAAQTGQGVPLQQLLKKCWDNFSGQMEIPKEAQEVMAKFLAKADWPELLGSRTAPSDWDAQSAATEEMEWEDAPLEEVSGEIAEKLAGIFGEQASGEATGLGKKGQSQKAITEVLQRKVFKDAFKGGRKRQKTT